VILIITNGQDATADFFEPRLRDAGVRYLRLNTERLADLTITLSVAGHQVDGRFGRIEAPTELREVSAVYFRRPIPPVIPDGPAAHVRTWMESEYRRAWGGLLQALPDAKWVNHPLAVSGASYKPEQLARASRLGLQVPPTIITNDPASAREFCAGHDWQVVAKPVGHGEVLAERAEEDRVVYTNRVDAEHAGEIDAVAHCPTLFQRYVAKEGDIRVTIAGEECIATFLHSQDRDVSKVDCRRENMKDMRYSLIELPRELVSRLVQLTRSYGLYYAAIDLVRDRLGTHWFLELNPAGQWAWLEQIAAAPISAALIRCLTSTA
jgi:glutathione synthase/RimK-type ligase-like ATP-grasp enzyme